MIEKTHICPSLLKEYKGDTAYSPRALKMLFDGQKMSCNLPYEGFESNELVETLSDNSRRISISGVQIKYAMRTDNGILRLTRTGEQGMFILKPIPNHIRNREFCPANEHVTMQIAAQVYGIPTAPNGLCFFKDGRPAYFVRRFDILDGKKLQKEDFASLAGLTRRGAVADDKYGKLSYEEFASIIEKYSATPQVDTLRFFELLLFNFVFCNGDAHLKNFSLLEDKNAKFRLSPAYDLLNTRLHIDDGIFAMHKGLFAQPRPEYFGIDAAVTGKTFYLFGTKIGLPGNLVNRILDTFCQMPAHIDLLIARSFLPEHLQREYKLMYKSRISSFLREGRS